jgi:hypothetical protein
MKEKRETTRLHYETIIGGGLAGRPVCQLSPAKARRRPHDL